MKNLLKSQIVRKVKGLFIATLFITTLTFAAPAVANNEPVIETDTMAATTTNHRNIEAIEDRVEEIRQMDLKNLPASERRALKKELREMEKDLRMYEGRGLYVSFGALIIILLLLIIIF